MTLVKTEKPDDIQQRVRNTRKLLVTVAVIMSAFLLVGGLATTVMIPKELFAEGGQANGRALSYLTHLRLGDTFSLEIASLVAHLFWHYQFGVYLCLYLNHV